MLEISGYYWIVVRFLVLKFFNGLIDDLGFRWLGLFVGFLGYKCIMGKNLI